jgi:hypothetical protein
MKIRDYKEGGIPLQSTAVDVEGVTRKLFWVVRAYDEEQIWDVRCEGSRPGHTEVYSFDKDAEITV